MFSSLFCFCRFWLTFSSPALAIFQSPFFWEFFHFLFIFLLSNAFLSYSQPWFIKKKFKNVRGKNNFLKVVLGESTLQWPLLGCHIILLSKGVHVWMYPTSHFWKKFVIFFHIMIEYNLGNIFKNKLLHFIL
jgi:hypothetical protein